MSRPLVDITWAANQDTGQDWGDPDQEMCSGSEAGSYLRLIDFVYHSTLGLRAIKKKSEKTRKGVLTADGMLSEQSNQPLGSAMCKHETRSTTVRVLSQSSPLRYCIEWPRQPSAT